MNRRTKTKGSNDWLEVEFGASCFTRICMDNIGNSGGEDVSVVRAAAGQVGPAILTSADVWKIRVGTVASHSLHWRTLCS